MEKSAIRRPESGARGSGAPCGGVPVPGPPGASTRKGEAGPVASPRPSILANVPRVAKTGWLSRPPASGTTTQGTFSSRPSAAQSSADLPGSTASMAASISSECSDRVWIVAMRGSVARSGRSSISHRPAHCAAVMQVTPSQPVLQRWIETGQVGWKRLTPLRGQGRSSDWASLI